MSWCKDLKEIMLQTEAHEGKTIISTGAKRKAEDAIVLRLRLLFGDNLNISKVDNKYFLDRRIKREVFFDPFAVSDEENPKLAHFTDPAYDTARIKEIFWTFIQNSINNSSINTIHIEQMKDFLMTVSENKFQSDRIRTEYIKTFYESFLKTEEKPDSFYLDCDYDDVPDMLKDRIDEINSLVRLDGMTELFDAFQECIESYEMCKWVHFERELLFENSTECERRLFEILYVKLTKRTTDYRYEEISPETRRDIIEAIDKMCEEGEIYKYFNLKEDNDILEIVKSVEYKLMWPECYRISHHLASLAQIFEYPKACEKILGSWTIQSFENRLCNLIQNHIDPQGLQDGSLLEKLIDYDEKDRKAMENQSDELFCEDREEKTE